MNTLPTDVEENELLKTIKSLRKEMIRVGIQKGLASKKTLYISQTLDMYITKYQSMKTLVK